MAEVEKKKVKGWTCSSFDLLHYGHILMLQECKNYCDHLIVGVQKDPSVDRPNKNKPIQSLEERIGQIQAVKYVDEVVLYDTEENLYSLLKSTDIDVRILGADWKDKPFTGHDLPMKVIFNSRNHSYSTTELKERVVKSNYNNLAEEIFHMQGRMDVLEENFFFKIMFILFNECDNINEVTREALIESYDMNCNNDLVPGVWDFDYQNDTLIIDECKANFQITGASAKQIYQQLGFDQIMIVYKNLEIQPKTISCKFYAENS